MTNLTRIVLFGGGLLAGLAVFLLKGQASWGDSKSARRRAGKHPPVEKLADELKNAWAEHHTRA